MSKFEHMPSSIAKRTAPKSEKGAFFTPDEAKGNKDFLNAFDQFEQEQESSNQPSKDALIKKEQYRAPDFQSFSRDVHNLEAELVKAVDAHSTRVGELIDRAKQMKEQAQTVVAEAYRRNLPREVITNFWQIENWLEQISSNPETSSRLIKQQYEASAKQEASERAASSRQEANEKETAHYANVSQEDMQKDLLMKKNLNDLRQRIITEYGVDPEKGDQEMGFGSKVKHFFSKFSKKGSLLDQYKKMQLDAAGEEPIELPMRSAVPEIIEDLNFNIPTRDSKDIPMRKATAAFDELVDDAKDFGKTFKENFVKDPTMWQGAGAAERQRQSEEKKSRDVKGFAKSFDLDDSFDIENEEPIVTPMEGRASSYVRDTAAALIPGVESVSEKQSRKVREQQGETVQSRTRSGKELEDEMLGANFDAVAERKAFRQKAADQMKEIAKRSKKQETSKVILSPDLEEEIEQLESGKKQIQSALKAKKQRELNEPVELPMRKATAAFDELVDDAKDFGKTFKENFVKDPTMWQGAGAAERQRQSEEKKSRDVKGFAKSFDLDDSFDIENEEPIVTPMEGRASSYVRDTAAALIPGVESVSEKQSRKVREQQGETVQSRTRSGKELEKDFLGSEAEQFASHRKDLRALAMSKGPETNLVKELNAKTGDAFFKDAPEVWEKAYKAAQKNLEASGESKSSGLESKAQQLATEYVMAFARLKAAELSGMQGKELAPFQKSVLTTRESVFTSKKPEVFQGMSLEDYKKYIKGKRKPLEATPERKPLNEEDEFEKLPADMEYYPKKSKKSTRKV